MGENAMAVGIRRLPAAQARKQAFLDSAFNIAEMKARQRDKIEEIRSALVVAGARTVGQQAKLLGLSRSTAWSVLRANYKSSGLSAGIIKRILASPRLPPRARQQILEYIHERLAGVYGHSERRRHQFAISLAIATDNQRTRSAVGAFKVHYRRRNPARRHTSQA
jgi:hypothetical protein